jgi:hypothetical protein
MVDEHYPQLGHCCDRTSGVDDWRLAAGSAGSKTKKQFIKEQLFWVWY